MRVDRFLCVGAKLEVEKRGTRAVGCEGTRGRRTEVTRTVLSNAARITKHCARQLRSVFMPARCMLEGKTRMDSVSSRQKRRKHGSFATYAFSRSSSYEDLERITPPAQHGTTSVAKDAHFWSYALASNFGRILSRKCGIFFGGCY